MDFLINRTNILDALTNDNPKVVENIGNLGKFLVNIIGLCGIDASEHYITQLNNKIMFDEVFGKVIGTSDTFLMKCFSGEAGGGQHMCDENDLIFAHLSMEDFPEAYEGVEKEYITDFGDILISNGFKEITDDLRCISYDLDFDIEDTRSFIYTVNKFGREFAPLFDQIIQYNVDLEEQEERRAEEDKDMNPDHFIGNPEIGYRYYVSYTYMKNRTKGSTIANVLVSRDKPINTVEDIAVLSAQIEESLTEFVKGTIMIIGFSYMGIERYEDVERELDDGNDDTADGYFFDEEDDDDYSEPDKQDTKNEEPSMKTFEIRYTICDNHSDYYSTIIPTGTNIDLTKCDDKKLAEIVADYEDIPENIVINISEVKEINLAPGDIPFKIAKDTDGENQIKS